MTGKYLFHISIGVLLLFSSCLSPPPASRSPPGQRVLLRTEPADKQSWVNKIPQSGTELFFVGVSRGYAAVAEARDDARNNAFTQVLRFYGELVQAEGRGQSLTAGSSGDTLAAFISWEETITSFAQGVVSQVGADQYYTEVYLDEKNKEEYTVYVLCQIPRQKAEEDIRTFAETTSAQYGNLLTARHSLYAALKMYADLIAALDQNPLHRAVAFYDGPQGRVRLYDYLNRELNALAASLSFTPLPAAAVQKTDTLDLTVQIGSPLMSVTGPLECSVAVYGMNNASPTAVYSVNADSSFPLKILTQKLECGKYTVRLEFLLNHISSHIAKNPGASFPLEVLSPNAETAFAGINLSQAERDIFLRGLKQGLDRNRTPLRLAEAAVNAQNRYGFVITVDPVPQGRADLVLCDVSLAFVRNGTVLRQSETRRIVEMDRNRAFTLGANFIRDQAGFFQGITETLH